MDYIVMEAVAVKALKEDDEAQKTAARERWKKDPEALKNMARKFG